MAEATSANPDGLLWQTRTGVTPQQIEAVCRAWQVVELAIFGSVLRDGFREDSDVDVRITFGPTAQRDAFDPFTMKEQLEGMFRRPVDVVERKAIRNPFRRHAILNSHRVVYAA